VERATSVEKQRLRASHMIGKTTNQSEPNKQISKPRERAISRKKHRTGTSQQGGKATNWSESKY